MVLSLRSHLVASYSTIILVTLAVVSAALVLLFNRYEQRLTFAQLTNEAITVRLQLQQMAERGFTQEQAVIFLGRQAEQLETEILLVDRSGRLRRIISSSSPEARLRALRIAAERLEIDVKNPRRGTYVDGDGRRYLYVIFPARDFPSAGNLDGPALVLAKPQKPVTATVQNLARIIGLSAIVGLVAAILAASVLAHWVFRPISRMTAAAEKVAAGDFSQRVPASGPPEVMQLAETFNRMASEVGRSQQSLRDFLANASHELKTPLTSIAGFAGALIDGVLSDRTGVERAARTIQSEAQRLQRLVAELLDLSRVEAGQAKLAMEEVDLKDLIKHCVEVLEYRASENGVSLRTDIPDGVIMRGDYDRLEQVFTNLIDNGLKHAGRGGHVRVAGRLQPNGDRLIAIEDTGPGLDPADLPRVFDRFFRAGRNRAAEGSGLGLAITRELVVAHGGRIEAANLPGSGARFAVTFPESPRAQAKA